MKKILLIPLFITVTSLINARSIPANTPPTTHQIPQLDENILTPQQVQQTAKNITVRINSATNGGSGVIIAQKGSNYLILTNAHVVKRASQIEIQAPDGQKYPTTAIDGGFDPKYDLALLQFTSTTKYTLANLASIAGTPIEPERTIYSAGFPFDSQDIRITKGQVSQLTDIPFNDGTQLGYTTDKGEKGIRQGMSGGAIIDAQGNLLGINTIGMAPILPDYTYNDGSKPIAKLASKYARANWGIPIYNFLTNVKPDLLYSYANLPKVEHQVAPTGYLAKQGIKARQLTVRIENSGGSGSGVIIARDGNNYYILTTKHVVQNPEIRQKYTNHQIITYDQDRHNLTGDIVAEGVDLAVIKFSSNSNYPVAQLGNYLQHNGDLAIVGGFPSRAKINSPLWQWHLNSGIIADRELGKLATQDKQSFSEGYDLIYTSMSYGGMSGGPVFDTAGNVIGIHGKAESTGTGATILGNSLGISIQTFLGLAPKLQIPYQLLTITTKIPAKLNLQDRRNLTIGIQNIVQPQADDDGKRWLAYGNQLYRTDRSFRSIAAFDRAIAKGEILLGGYGKALSAQAIGEYQLAANAIAQAILAISPQDRAKYYYFWKRQSSILEVLGKDDRALESIDLAISLEQTDPILLSIKAQLFAKKKQYAQTIAIYDLMISKQPEAYTYNNRGNAKSDLGQKQAAIIDYNLAIALNPEYANTYNNRGNVKSELGDKQAAIIDYDRAIALNSEYAMAYYNRGNTKAELGDVQSAISDYDRAISLNPNLINAYYNRGNVKSELGEDRAALVDYDRAIALNPNLTNAYYHRGNIRSDLGDKNGAITDLTTAAELFRQQAQMDSYQATINLLAKIKK
jgi:tetratricopeptide (TPR) repeat protein/S1-C subfamily serine protease